MKRRAAPALFTVVVVTILIGLGVWQLERREWKAGLIATREVAHAAAPSPPPQTVGEARALEFHRIAAAGVWLGGKTIRLHAISPKGTAGFAVLTPLREASGHIIIVDRGFIPSGAQPPAAPTGTVGVEGLLRLAPGSRPGWFTPDNRPEAGDWYWIDLPAIAAVAGLGEIAPFYLDLNKTPAPLPNDHLQYAITWFSLAAAAIVIYLLFERHSSRGNDGSLSPT